MKKAFTLIELLAVATIIVVFLIISAVIIVGFTSRPQPASAPASKERQWDLKQTGRRDTGAGLIKRQFIDRVTGECYYTLGESAIYPEPCEAKP